ncbi:MAG TPA: TldD/PmbA family protein [Syntrophorhabdaceae bacterium]|nr:TldD/PmbA family protein [Syntrophorhabdaceae bacterium]
MDITKAKDAIDSKFDSYELYYLKERIKKFESKEKEICGIEFKEEEGIALRAIKDSRMAFAYTYDREGALEALLKNTSALIPITEKDEQRSFPGPYSEYSSLSLYDEEGLAMNDANKTGLLIDMEKGIREYDKRIMTVRNCELQEIEFEAKIRNSNGLTAEGKKTLYVMSALCVAKDQDEVSWYDWSWANRFTELEGKQLGEKIAEKTISLLSSKQIGTGVYEGILKPQAACDMLGILSDSFLAESLFKNKTRLKAKEGTRCFSDVLSIIDSGKLGVDAFGFDGEGVPSRENLIVINGYFETFLYDSYYGRKFGVASTANSVRGGVKDLPKCGPRGLFVKQGERSLEGAFRNGVVIEELMGTHTANSVTGDFSLGALGYLCKNGQKTPFQGVIMSGNVFEVLKNVREVGNDLKFYGVFGSPSLFVANLKISGT